VTINFTKESTGGVFQMKQIAESIKLSLALIVITISFGCEPRIQKTQQNDFFEPVNRIEYKKVVSDTLIVTLKSDSTHVNDSLKDSLVILSRQQHKNENQDHPIIGANVVPVQPTPVQQVPVLIANAKTVSIQPTSSHQVSVPKNINTSLNYGKAIQLYKDRQYAKAINVFKKLLKLRIEPNLADRYHFWMGVCYLDLNKSVQAIKEFTYVLRYTNSEKVEDAYFMIGQCYERIGIGDKKSAIRTYEKMLRIYPNGDLKQIAEKKLALLK